MRPEGTGFHSLGPGSGPSWTPDGRIVFVQGDAVGQNTSIRVVALDGTAADLFAAAGQISGPRMLAGGGVVFSVSGDLWRLDAGSSSPVRLTQGLQVVAGPSLSPDGRWAAIAVAGASPGLDVVSLEGGWVQISPGLVADIAWQPGGPIE